MSLYESIKSINPDGIEDDVLHIYIDDEDDAYCLADCITRIGTYTFSVWIRADTDTEVSFYVLGNYMTFQASSEWQKMVCTVTADSLEDNYIDIIPDAGINIYLYEAKLQEGRYDTRWCPAEEDVAAEFRTHQARIEANEQSIALKVSTELYETDKAAQESRFESVESSIGILQEDIVLKVTQTDIDNSLKGYSTTAQMQSMIELSKTGILQTVSETYATQDGLVAVQSTADQAADHISWIVKSGTSATDFTLTDRTAQLITDSLVIKDSTGASTIISGGKMDINQIFAQDITATGTITGVKLSGATGVFADKISISKDGTDSDIKIEEVEITNYSYSLNNGELLPSTSTQIKKALSLSTDLKILYAPTAVYSSSVDANVISAKTKLQAPLIMSPEIYANTFYERGTALSGKYAALSHTHSYLPLAGGTMTGNLSVPSVYTSSWFRSTGDTGWYNETYGGGIYMDNTEYVKVYNGKKFYSPSEICASLGGASGQFRAVNGNYGFFIRNDGANTYFMLTNSGDAYGTWNSLRPLIIGNSTGKVTIGTDTLFNSEISSNGNIYLGGYGKGVRWNQTWGQAGITSLSDGGSIALYSQKTGSTSWTNAITLVNSNGEIQIAAKNHTHPYLPLAGGTVTGTTHFNDLWSYDYEGHNRKPASSASADGARVSYIASKLRTSDTKYYVTIQGQYGTTGSTYKEYNYLSTSSDVRLKENIVDSNVCALDTINEIKIRQFDYRQTGQHQKIGVVADELELIDTAFTFGGGYTEDGSMNIKSVDTFYMMGYVVKGMQEICAIDAEKNIRLDELDRKYMSHEAQIESLQQQLIDARQQITEQSAEIAQLRGMIGTA